MAETPIDLSLEEIKARERMVAEDVAKRNAEPVKDEVIEEGTEHGEQ